MKQLGPRGASLIKGTETLRLVAYKPTPDDVWTIGWGHTRGVREGMDCTVEQAEQWFAEDTAEAVAAVNKLPARLSQSMFDSLVSLAFNAGASVTPGNTIWRELAAGDYFKAWRGISLWTKQAGKDLRGLAARRALEMSLFMEDPLP